ncbi:probable protein phosphatase 2C 2 [Coffea eugenioides]|uniref:protein-serine/threonine phosphatase n=1 Tax=Coffea arabica TaxID=13443 RepID=A0ABM4WRS1_COFAR|nr:probable protein phosphatase 2C 2 [Coffea eugenioides]
MPGAVAVVASSPVFMPSPRPRLSPIFCKATSSSPSPSPSSPSPLSPFTLRLQKQATNLFNYSSTNRYGNTNISKSEAAVCSTSSASTTTFLKRKRPGRIDIPNEPLRFDSTPGDGERIDEVEAEGEGYAVYCKRGKRRAPMEDRHSAASGVLGDPKQAIFGVFDGHGGAKAAEFAAKNLNKNIMNEVARRSGECIEVAISEGYLTTDAECLKEDISGGTCCVTALIQQGNLVVSNAGDCRAVLSRGGVAEALTVDHRPSRQDERERIEGLGGYVDCCHGVWRIQGSLAVSRGLGDRHLKPWVIPKPDTKIVKIRPECEFLIMASDGLWDKVSNQEAVDVVRPLCMNVDNSDRHAACRKLVDLSVERGSTDDISVMLIQLGHFIPSVMQGAEVI